MNQPEQALKQAMDEALTSWKAPAEMKVSLNDKLCRYYSQGVFISGFKDAIGYIYDNELPDYHDIFDLTGGLFLILSGSLAFPKECLLRSIEELRAGGVNPAGTEFQESMNLLVSGVKLAHQHMLSLRNSRRRAGEVREIPNFPDFETLRKFHECSRKTKHASLDDAEESLNAGQRAYACSHCSSWHKGHPPGFYSHPREVMERRYQRTWRRYMDV
jgi:hypothetical protein